MSHSALFEYEANWTASCGVCWFCNLDAETECFTGSRNGQNVISSHSEVASGANSEVLKGF